MIDQIKDVLGIDEFPPVDNDKMIEIYLRALHEPSLTFDFKDESLREPIKDRATIKDSVSQSEETSIRELLEKRLKNKWTMKKTVEHGGMSRATLDRKIRKYHLHKKFPQG